MPDILIRNVPNETVRRLNILAAVAGVSREEFLLRLLEQEGARFSLAQVEAELSATPAAS
jgi:plasmid stability protein